MRLGFSYSLPFARGAMFRNLFLLLVREGFLPGRGGGCMRIGWDARCPAKGGVNFGFDLT